MSPSEFELRAALHDGEGGAPDADVVIAQALRVRHERRRLITSVASAAAVVAVVAVGGTLLVACRLGRVRRRGGAGGALTAPGSRRDARREPQPSAAGDPAIESDRPARTCGAAMGVACAAQFPRLAVPGGGGTNQFGADQPLFAAPVAAMKICVYGSTSALVQQTVLESPAASDVAAELESGKATDRPGCTATTGEGDLAVYAVTSAGTPLPVVTVELRCPYQATNGTAVRYLSTTAVDAVRPYLAPSPNQGSPIK